MKLSTKGRYGLKAMFELALNYGEEPISIKYISEKQNVSERYLEQIFSKLKKAGLVKSIRGSQGGYFLARKPDEISVGDILTVLEGPITIADCLKEEGVCSNSDKCATRLVWKKMKNAIDDVVNTTFLQDMVDDRIGDNGLSSDEKDIYKIDLNKQ